MEPHKDINLQNWKVDMPNQNNLLSQTGTEIGKGIAELVPTVYKDVIQPAAKETGQTLETVAKTVNVVLAPL